MLVIGIICLFVAAVSYFRYLNVKKNQPQDKNNEAGWQRGLAIVFLIFGILLVGFAIYLRRF